MLWMMTFKQHKFYFICFLVIAFLISVFFVFETFLLPVDLRGSSKELFSVQKGQPLSEVAKNLKERSFIKSEKFFVGLMFVKGKSNKILAGDYFLSRQMSMLEISKIIAGGDVLLIKLTVPEGFNLKQTSQRLQGSLGKQYFQSEKDYFDKKQEIAKIENYRIGDFKKDYSFLEDAPSGALLEGFLFPDTYHLSLSADSSAIAREMLDNFDKKLSRDLREEIENQGKTVFEIVVMASLIEKEVRGIDDKEIVSGILWKRIRAGMPLQVDATIAYLTGKKTTETSIEETKIDSLYNTYKYRGLPIGPICNPGIEAIEATVFPRETDFWYYLSKPDGETVFSRTLKEHAQAKQRYLK